MSEFTKASIGFFPKGVPIPLGNLDLTLTLARSILGVIKGGPTDYIHGNTPRSLGEAPEGAAAIGISFPPMELSCTPGPTDSPTLREFTLSLTANEPVAYPISGLRLVLEIRRNDGDPIPPETLSWVRNGWQSWSHAGLVHGQRPAISVPRRAQFMFDMKEDPSVPVERAAYVSDMVTQVHIRDWSLLVGAIDQRYFQKIALYTAPEHLELHLDLELDECTLAAGETLELGGWRLESGKPESPLMERWGGRVGKRKSRQETVLGWCSWYERKTRITLPYLRSIVDIITRREELRDLELIQVDDGYQKAVGDWLLPNPRFRGRLKEAGELITSAGKEAGVWVSPFIAQKNSDLFRDHRDWFLHDGYHPVSAGWNPHWRSSFYPLDLTQPQVIEWLGDTFSTLRSWGFTFFKLDYLYGACWKILHKFGRKSRFQAFQEAIGVIRKAAGPESFLLGCGAPLAPSNGLFDAMRVSCDTEFQWKNPPLLRMLTGETETIGIYPAARNTLVRNPFARHMWLQDPDCLMVRRRNRRLSDNEVDLYSLLCMAVGEMVLIGDDLTRWAEEDFARFAQYRSQLSTGFRALDSLADDPPRLFSATQGGRPILGALNLSDAPNEITLPEELSRVGESPISAQTQSPGSPEGTRITLAPHSLTSWHADRFEENES